jgi:hypothetical protein
MRTIKNNVLRREVVEAYLRYDTEKKHAQMADLADWDWNDPNYLCCVLSQGDYKGGVITGFSTWEHVAISLDDLRQCAVVDTISKGWNSHRDLGSAERKFSFEIGNLIGRLVGLKVSNVEMCLASTNHYSCVQPCKVRNRQHGISKMALGVRRQLFPRLGFTMVRLWSHTATAGSSLIKKASLCVLSCRSYFGAGSETHYPRESGLYFHRPLRGTQILVRVRRSLTPPC